VGLWLKLIGLVQRTAATWRSAAYISPRPCNSDGSCYGTLEIVGGIIIIIIIIIRLAATLLDIWYWTDDMILFRCQVLTSYVTTTAV